MSSTLKEIAAIFYPTINMCARKLRQTKEEDKSQYTNSCIEFLNWHGPGVRLTADDDDGFFYSYDKSEKKDIKHAIHLVMEGGRERTVASIEYFAASGGKFKTMEPSLLMPNNFLSKTKK